MAQTSYSVKDLPPIDRAKVAILQSAWYREHTDLMVEKCRQVLIGARAEDPEVHILPGCLELPLGAQRLKACDPQIEAIVVFGVIVKGETDHYDIVRNESSRGLMEVSLKLDIPVINEILPVLSMEHVTARASNDNYNKGFEAGIAAVQTIAWRRAHPVR